MLTLTFLSDEKMDLKMLGPRPDSTSEARSELVSPPHFQQVLDPHSLSPRPSLHGSTMASLLFLCITFRNFIAENCSLAPGSLWFLTFCLCVVVHTSRRRCLVPQSQGWMVSGCQFVVRMLGGELPSPGRHGKHSLLLSRLPNPSSMLT